MWQGLHNSPSVHFNTCSTFSYSIKCFKRPSSEADLEERCSRRNPIRRRQMQWLFKRQSRCAAAMYSMELAEEILIFWTSVQSSCQTELHKKSVLEGTLWLPTFLELSQYKMLDLNVFISSWICNEGWDILDIDGAVNDEPPRISIHQGSISSSSCLLSFKIVLEIKLSQVEKSTQRHLCGLLSEKRLHPSTWEFLVFLRSCSCFNPSTTFLRYPYASQTPLCWNHLSCPLLLSGNGLITDRCS